MVEIGGMLERYLFSMASRIHLVRHGVSAHVHDGTWLNAASARRFVELYDAAGIKNESPPAAAIAAAAGADILAASTLPRAIASIERLAPGRQAELTSLLREVDFESPSRWPIRLPVHVWDSIDYVATGYRIWRRAPTANMQRAREATDWLLARLGKSATLLAVTHGGFRRFLWASLIDRGWKPEFRRAVYHNWSVWSFRSP
jgi:broad specificity phosphatase PhoE